MGYYDTYRYSDVQKTRSLNNPRIESANDRNKDLLYWVEWNYTLKYQYLYIYIALLLGNLLVKSKQKFY